jgi:hypothetical protein
LNLRNGDELKAREAWKEQTVSEGRRSRRNDRTKWQIVPVGVSPRPES